MKNPITRRKYEDAALNVVAAIKRDYMPDMDDNDGGQILVWILDVVESAVEQAEAALAGMGEVAMKHITQIETLERCVKSATERADTARREALLTAEREAQAVMCSTPTRVRPSCDVKEDIIAAIRALAQAPDATATIECPSCGFLTDDLPAHRRKTGHGA